MSQQLIGSAGNTYKNTSYQLDWSIGEILSESYSVTSQNLTQGFQQGNYTITAVEQLKELDFEIRAYPNPATDFIILNVESSKLENLDYSILNMQGYTLQMDKITGDKQHINFSNYDSGTYFIIIKQNNQFFKSFKIIKTK